MKPEAPHRGFWHSPCDAAAAIRVRAIRAGVCIGAYPDRHLLALRRYRRYHSLVMTVKQMPTSQMLISGARMTNTVPVIPQIADDETLEAMDAVLSAFECTVEVRGNVDDKPGMSFRVAGYRLDALEPLVRPHDSDRADHDFQRTHYSSMAFLFERLGEAQAFERQFG